MHQALLMESQGLPARRLRGVAVRLLALVGILVVAFWRLDLAPPLSWDEGWTLTLARTWVEQGHYGLLLDGQLRAPGLNAAFPVTAPVALSLKILGVGAWQGRLPGVLFTLAAMALMYWLANRLYNRTVARAALFVLLLMAPNVEVHPLMLGRVALAEGPALFYLLAGYAAFLLAWRRPRRFMPLTVLAWAIAVMTKVQVAPFFAASLLIPLGVAVLARQRRPALLLAVGLAGSLALAQLLSLAVGLALRGHTLYGAPLSGLYEVTALVTAPIARLVTLVFFGLFGLPAAFGLGYAALQVIRHRSTIDLSDGATVVRLALLTLSGSWLAWYVILSVGWPRYMYPATFVGSIFAGALLRDFIPLLRRSLRPGSGTGEPRRLHLAWRQIPVAFGLAAAGVVSAGNIADVVGYRRHRQRSLGLSGRAVFQHTNEPRHARRNLR